jgi:hypothetical protein
MILDSENITNFSECANLLSKLSNIAPKFSIDNFDSKFICKLLQKKTILPLLLSKT